MAERVSRSPLDAVEVPLRAAVAKTAAGRPVPAGWLRGETPQAAPAVNHLVLLAKRAS